MDRLFGEEKPKPKVPSVRIPNFGNAVSANKSMLDSRVKDQNSPSTVVKSSVTGRPLSWAGIPGAANVQDVTNTNIHTENKTSSQKPETKKPASSSSSGSSSPPLYKYNPRKPQTYKGAGSQYIVSSDEETHPVEGLGRGWRPGQPPRGDVVVKLNVEKPAAPKSVINSDHSEALATNRALTSHAAISSKVPASMGDKYQIPGLFIKPSVKTAPKSVTKPVEAKLTLKPEGTMSLTTKVVEDKDKPGYQSSIFTPSKSPLLDARKEQRSQLGERQAASTPSAKPQGSTSSEPKKEESEESEWEYYTETEPSDEDEKPAQKASLQPPTECDEKKEKVSVEQNGSKAPDARSTNGVPVPPSKPQTVFPPPTLPPAQPGKPAPKKHPVKVEEVAVIEKKRPVQTKVEMTSSKPVVIGVAALRKTKPDPPASLPEPIIEEDSTGSGPGYSAPVTFKPKPKQVEEKTKPTEVKPAKKLPVAKSSDLTTAVSKSKEPLDSDKSVLASNANVKKAETGAKSASDKNGLAANANVKKSDAKVSSAEAALPSAASQTAAVKKSALGNTRPEAQVALLGQAKNTEVSKNNGVNHAKESAVSEPTTKKAGDKAAGKTADAAKVAGNENSVSEIGPKKARDPVTAEDVLPPPEQAAAASKSAAGATKKDPKPTSNGISNAKKPVGPKPANKESIASAAPATKSEDLLSPKPVRKEAKQASVPPPAAKKTIDSNVSPIKEAKIKETPAPSPPKKQENNTTTGEPDVLRRTEFDWTKSPSPMSPMSPKSPSPMSPSPTQMTAASLDRLPSALKKMFVTTENAPKEKTADSPAWFDNVPSESSTKAMKEMNAMKADASRTQTKQSREEANLIKVSDVAVKPWYDDEDEDMQELLKNRPTILREIDQTQDRRLTPEENMAVIKMYGGVMFPGGEVEKTPKSWLFKIRKALMRGNSVEKRKAKEDTAGRAGSSSSNSSSVSSELLLDAFVV